MVPADLNDEQIGLLRQLLEDVVSPAVRCRLGDVLWVARRDASSGAKAVPAYIAFGILLEDPDMWPPCMECYERAIRLARSLGRHNPLLTTALQHLADRVAYHKGEDGLFFTSSALALLQDFRFGDATVLSGYALVAAKRRNTVGDPHSARTYWDVAAKLLTRAGLPSEAEQARVESAQTWVTEADIAVASGNHMAAQSHLDSAIQAYRAIPKCKHLLPSLHRRLDAAGAEAIKLMRVISSEPIDLGPLVRDAQESVRGRPTAEAIYALACVAPSIDPDSLRTQVMASAKEMPLSSLFTSVTYDHAGKVVHKTPSLSAESPEERERAVEAQMARHADLRRSFTVRARILPALMALLGEHVIEESDIASLLEGSSLASERRLGLFAKGLAAGFCRDMTIAVHLLVPQLEHAVRMLLQNTGTITTRIDQDGTQSELSLKSLLSLDSINLVLPDTLVFEIRTLLIYKGSSNIRNKLCHGLIEADEFETINVLYFWWIVLKTSLHGTPGFQAWLDEWKRTEKLRTESDGHNGNTE